MSSSDEGEVTSNSNKSNGRIFKKIRSNFTIVEKLILLGKSTIIIILLTKSYSL